MKPNNVRLLDNMRIMMNIEDTLEVTSAVDQAGCTSMADVNEWLRMHVKPKRKGRGKGKKPSMVSTSVRVPEYVLNWFMSNHPYGLQPALRAVLIKHVDDNTKHVEDNTKHVEDNTNC